MIRPFKYRLAPLLPLLGAALLFSPAVPGASDLSPGNSAPSRLLVRFCDGVRMGERAAVHEKLGGVRKHSFRRIPIEVVQFPEGSDLFGLAAGYAARPEVVYAEPNYLWTTCSLPDDPFFPSQWSLHNTGQSGGEPGSDIAAAAAWAVATGSRSVIVAVLDTGIEYTHPDLAANIWVNPAPTFGDLYGARWTDGEGKVTSADPLDDHGHGTHIAGIIGAQGDNALGVAGVNWRVSLMALKCLDNSGSFGTGYTADIIAAMEYALDYGAAVLSVSWGSQTYSAALQEAIAAAGEAGALLVAAAGNNNQNLETRPYYPAAYDNENIIAVGAGTDYDHRNGYSSYGLESVDLLAPGTSIFSTWTAGTYRSRGATSASAAHVAGAAALLLSTRPEAGWPELKDWILGGVDIFPWLAGRFRSSGRLNLAQSLSETGETVLHPYGDFTSAGEPGGPFTPEAKVYTLRNAGDETLNWTASADVDWLTLAPAAGRLPAGEEVEITVSFNASAAALGVAIHHGEVVFRNEDRGEEQIRKVVLNLVSLQRALDHEFLTWTTGGDAEWFGQTAQTVDGEDAARSGPIDGGRQSWLETTVPGPGHLSFNWKIASSTYCYLELYLNGVRLDRIEKQVEWEERRYYLEEGRHTLRWRFYKPPFYNRYPDIAWLDQVVYTLDDTLLLSPFDEYTASGDQGGPFAPSGKTYTLTNLSLGGETVDWKILPSVDWFTVEPLSGRLEVGETVEISVRINELADEFAPGRYEDYLYLDNVTSGYIHSRRVALEVIAIPGTIAVEDSISPADDRELPFGSLLVGESRGETIAIRNTDPVYPLTVNRLTVTRLLETFASGEAPGWEPTVPGQWSVQSGEYRAGDIVRDYQMQSTYAGRLWTDCRFGATIRRVGDRNPVFRMLLRASADFDNQNSRGSAYAVGVFGTGRFWVGKYLDGKSYYLQSLIASPYLLAGDNSNRVDFNIAGDQLEVYLNGHLAWTGVDGDIPGPGRVGFGPYTPVSAPTEFFHDDVVVAEEIPGSALGAPGRSASFGPTDGTEEGPFRFSDLPELPLVLAAGDSHYFGVDFAPIREDFREGWIRIGSADRLSPEVEVRFNGSGHADFLAVAERDGFAAAGEQGGPFRPAGRTYTLANHSPTVLDWTAASGEEWLSLTPDSGRLEAGAEAEVEVRLNAEAAALDPGLYPGEIVFTNPETGYSRTREVSLAVIAIPGKIAVEDSVSPVDDLRVPFGELIVGNHRSERITIRNPDPDYSLPVSRISLLGSAVPAPPVSAEPEIRNISGSLKGRTVFPLAAPHRPDLLLVRFREDLRKSQREDLHRKLGTRSRHSYRKIPVEVVEIPEGGDLAALLAAYEKLPEVVYAEPNYEFFPAAVPDDPRFSELWGLRNTGQTLGTPGADIAAAGVWEEAVGSGEVIVAVIDTGINYRHEDLAANMWVNPAPTFGDLYGARWTDGDGTATRGDPMDGHGHGTHCAGIIGAVGNNGLGVAGVNWNVRLMALKFLQNFGGGATADAISALEYAIDHGAHLTSNSWGGGGYSLALKEMIAAAGQAGQLFVAAAGNSATNNDSVPHYPSSYDCANIISVAASDHNDIPAYFSSYGRFSVDLAAPGLQILSTWKDGNYELNSGTSMACPHVSGAAALLLSLHPGAGHQELKNWILAGVDLPPAWEGKTATGGRLNLAGALARAQPNFSLLGRPPLPFSIPPGGEVSLEIKYHPVVPGDHRGRVRIESADRENPLVEVELEGRGRADDLVLSPQEPFAAVGPAGGPFAPEEKIYLLSNTGPESRDWTVTSAESWLEITPAAGRLAAGESVEVALGFGPAAALRPGGLHRDTVIFRNAATGGTQSVSATLNISIPLCAALDNCDLSWLTTRFYSWFGQYGVTSDGWDAAQSGRISNGQETWLEAEVQGPGRLDFAWKVSSEANYDCLEFYLGGLLQDRISGETAWREESYPVPAGRQTLRWRYVKDGSEFRGADCGWVDQVVYRLDDALSVLPFNDFLAAGYQGGPFDPGAALYTLDNNGSSALEWAVSAAGWLAAEPVAGRLEPGDSIAVEIRPNAEADGLASGFYEETASFANLLSGFSQLRLARLEVLPLPGVIAVADSISPADDLELPFGTLPVGEMRTERVTIRNLDGESALGLKGIQLQGGYPAGVAALPSAPEIRARAHPPSPPAAAHRPATLLVRFRDGVRKEARGALHRELGGQVVHAYRRIPVEVVEVKSEVDLAALLAAYQDRPEVAYVEPNYQWSPAVSPDDPLFPEQWALRNTGQTGGAPGADIRAPEAWEIAVGSPEVVVAVIDSGIDYHHPDLAPNIWINPHPSFGDLHGARWTGGNGVVTSGNPLDGHGHGSHCAGIIGAAGNNALGVCGLNWRVRLMALKFLSDSGSGYTADALSALEYALDHGAHLTSNSWGGGGYSRALEEMIAVTGAAGRLFVAAAGNNLSDNDSVPFYPASYDLANIIAVAASDYDDRPYLFSNYGLSSVDLAAPGVSILSTITGGEYGLKTGTSMAAPQVTGTAALILSLIPAAAPELVKGWILEGVDPVPDWEGLTATGGRLNAGAALRLARPHFYLAGLPELPLSLSPGEALTFEVVYQPLSSGGHGDRIQIESNDRYRPEIEVNLTGFASSPTPTASPLTPSPTPVLPTPVLTVTPTPLPPAPAASATCSPSPTPEALPTVYRLITAGKDYNGDGRDDRAIWKPAAGKWMAYLGPPDASRVLYYGKAGDIPVPGDYDGDGATDPAVFRGASSLWAIQGTTRFYFGVAGDIPVPADYNGDGTPDPAIYRGRSGLWAVRGLTRAYFGRSGDIPVPGDYDGSGTARPGIYRRDFGLWVVRGLSRAYFGLPGDYPLPPASGGGLRIGVFREASSLWAIRGWTRLYFGRPGDYPQPGNYRGDGEIIPAVYRPSSGLWAVRGLTRNYWGGPADLPLSW